MKFTASYLEILLMLKDYKKKVVLSRVFENHHCVVLACTLYFSHPKTKTIVVNPEHLQSFTFDLFLFLLTDIRNNNNQTVSHGSTVL